MVSPTGVLTTDLSLVRLRDGLFVFVSGRGEIVDVEIELWAEAIATAFQNLSRDHPQFDWWAVLGPPPRRSAKPFIGAIDLDRLTLRTAEFGYRETVLVSLRGSSRSHHWIPVVVKGRSGGYDWDCASHAAHRDLYAVAALLSLESGDCWTLRERPTPPEWGGPVLFESIGPLRRLDADEEAQRRDQAAVIDCGRLANAWRELGRDRRLIRPLSAYYQGISLIDDQPSFAVVAFVTTIEEVGTLLIPRETPEVCAACQRPKFNSSRRLFRKTLELVRSTKRAMELTKNLYGWRSATAHSGQLFGYEMAFGDQPHAEGRLPLNVADTFRGAVRVRAQDAAKDLLQLALGGSLPLQPSSKQASG